MNLDLHKLLLKGLISLFLDSLLFFLELWDIGLCTLIYLDILCESIVFSSLSYFLGLDCTKRLHVYIVVLLDGAQILFVGFCDLNSFKQLFFDFLGLTLTLFDLFEILISSSFLLFGLLTFIGIIDFHHSCIDCHFLLFLFNMMLLDLLIIFLDLVHCLFLVMLNILIVLLYSPFSGFMMVFPFFLFHFTNLIVVFFNF